MKIQSRTCLLLSAAMTAGPPTMSPFCKTGQITGWNYIVDGRHAMLAFITIRNGRSGCIRTSDGGRTWRFAAWIGPDYSDGIKDSTLRKAYVSLT